MHREVYWYEDVLDRARTCPPPYSQHVARGVADDALCNAPQQQAPDAAPPMRTNDEQPGGHFCGIPFHCVGHVRASHQRFGRVHGLLVFRYVFRKDVGQLLGEVAPQPFCIVHRQLRFRGVSPLIRDYMQYVQRGAKA